MRATQIGWAGTFVATIAVAVALLAGPAPVLAAGPTCARTTDPSTPASASQGNPCWTDVLPYPFGSDGNPVDPHSALCAMPHASNGGWAGDYSRLGGGVIGNPPCYLGITSLAFRAWNRGLAAAGPPDARSGGGANFGVWLYNGNSWYPDPAFPGASACPGNTVLWAGKLDYWLIGASQDGLQHQTAQTLCRFDGSSLVWEPLKLPAATLNRLPQQPQFGTNTTLPIGGITSGACFAWNNCWFFGTAGIEVHWDGQTLSDTSSGFGASPWLQGNFTGAVARTDAFGRQLGLAVTTSFTTTGDEGVSPLPARPDGSPPPQLFGSGGGPFGALGFTPPTSPRPGDPYRTDIAAVDADPQGDAWVAGNPTSRSTGAGPAPLLPVTTDGVPAPCPGYDATTFSNDFSKPPSGSEYKWYALSIFPGDGSALAAAQYSSPDAFQDEPNDYEPGIVRAACGQPPAVTRFRIADPRQSPASGATVPADWGGFTSAVAAPAGNDAWASTSSGALSTPSQGPDTTGPQRPHLYQLTDGQPPNAPPGDDREARPSLFTIDPPTYVQPPPAVVVLPATSTTTTKHGSTRTTKAKPAVYQVAPPKVRKGPHGRYLLVISFKVRAAVTIGLDALRGRRVVATTGLRRFKVPSGKLVLSLDRRHWPTGLKFIYPRKPKS